MSNHINNGLNFLTKTEISDLEEYNEGEEQKELNNDFFFINEDNSIVAEPLAGYATMNSTAIEESIDTLIAEARKAMEEAAKQLDFQNAAKHRDRMYELQKIKERKVRN